MPGDFLMMQGMSPDKTNGATAPEYQLLRPDRPYAALGLAVSYLMNKPAFASRPFGQWAQILVGQVNRGQYWLVADHKGAIVGFAGWAFANAQQAEAWLTESKPIDAQSAEDGACMIINAWAGDTFEISRFIRSVLRKEALGKKIYAKRYYPDGRVRPMRLKENRFIERHISLTS